MLNNSAPSLLIVNWWIASVSATVILLTGTSGRSNEIESHIEALKVQNAPGRESAAYALEAMGPVAKAAVPHLIEALKDENLYVRLSAAYALGGIGPDAKVAVPDLIEALMDENLHVRMSAAYALGQIGPESRAVIPKLMEALKDENFAVRKSAARALGRIGPDAKVAVPHLIEVFRARENPYVRQAVAYALGQMGPDAKAVIPDFVEALRDEDFRFVAWPALGKIGAASAPHLIKVLKDENASVRRSAANALGTIGPDAVAAVPYLMEVLKDQNSLVRQAAADALGQIGTDAKAEVPPRIESLIGEKDEKIDAHRSAVGVRSQAGAGLRRDDVAKAKLYVLNSAGDDTTVINIPQHNVIGRIKVGAHPHGIEAAAQNRMFISAETGNRINVIDTVTDIVLKRIPVGEAPNEVAATPDGRLLYVPSGETGFYEVVDLEKGKIVAKIKTGGYPHNVVAAPDGKYMYLSPMADPERIFIVETATHRVVREIPLGAQARPLAISPDGQRLYIEYDPFIGFVQAKVPEGKILHRVPIKPPPDKQHLPSKCHGIGVTPDGKEVWVCVVSHQNVAVFDVSTDPPTQVALVPTKGHPYWLTFSPDGTYCYVSNVDVDLVQVVKVATRQTVKWIPVGKGPKRLLAVTVP